MGSINYHEAADRYRHGDTLETLAAELGKSVTTVWNNLQKMGVESRSRGHKVSRPAPPRDELFTMVHVQRLTDPEIALQRGVSRRTVQRWRRDHGIESFWTSTAPRTRRR